LSDISDLSELLSRHGLVIDASFIPQLQQYAKLLWQWNERLNLTRHTDAESFVTRDVMDTLQLLPFIRNGASVVDVGTGGGVPGILIAILRPDVSVTLVESVARKTEALRAIVDAVPVEVSVVNARAEDHLQHDRYDILTARAVAALPKLLKWFRPALVDRRLNRALLVKGPRWKEEEAESRKRRLCKDVNLREIATWQNAGRDGHSVLLELSASRRR